MVIYLFCAWVVSGLALALAVAFRVLRAPELASYDRYVHATIALCALLLIVLPYPIDRIVSTPIYGCAATPATTLVESGDLTAIRAVLHEHRQFKDLYARRVDGRELVIEDGLPEAHGGWWWKVNGPGIELLNLWAATYHRQHPSERGPVNVSIVYPDGQYLTFIAPADCVSL